MAPRGKNPATSADSWLIEGAEPARTKATEKAASDDDFIAEAPPPKPKPVAENVGAETRQWLAVPEPTNGASAAEVRKAQTRKRAPKPKAKRTTGNGKQGTAQPDRAKELDSSQREEISELGKRIRELQTRLRVQARDAKSEIATVTKERDSLHQRVDQLTSELADAKKRAATKTTRRSTSTTGTPRRQKTRPQPKAKARAKAPAKAPPKAPARRTARRKNGQLDLNAATFEELRGLGLSVTQSARVIAYRDVRGGYQSLDELDAVPGLSDETRGELRAQLQL